MLRRKVAIFVAIFAVIAIAVAPMSEARRRDGGRRNAQHSLRSNITAEQREAIHAKVKELKEAGATREEIHAAIAELRTELGIEAPAKGKNPRRRGKGRFKNLTDEQRQTIRAKVKELKDAGATREEIHAAIVELGKELGFKVPFKPKHRRKLFKNLTDEQRQTIRAKVKELKDAGATREEIYEAVDQLLKEYLGEEFDETRTSAAPGVDVDFGQQISTWGAIKSR